MKTHTTIRHPGAIALGCFFTGVTGYVLFKDVLDGAAISTNHVLSLAALVAALSSGHMALPELKAGRVVSALFLGLLFVASTSYVVISSGARNAETAATKAAIIAQHNTDRAEVETRRVRAQAMLDEEYVATKCACEGKVEGRVPQAGPRHAMQGQAGDAQDLPGCRRGHRRQAGKDAAEAKGERRLRACRRGASSDSKRDDDRDRDRASAQVVATVRGCRDSGAGNDRVPEHRSRAHSKTRNGSGCNSYSEKCRSRNSEKSDSDKTHSD